VKKVQKRVQILLFCIAKIICLLVLSKVVFALGYALMEDLSRAVDQFYPSASGGMSGGPSTPPGPPGDSSLLPLASPHLNNETEARAEASGHAVAHPATESPLQTVARVIREHERIALLVQDIHRELRTTVPAGSERLAEMLEESHSGEQMTEIRQSLETRRAQSPYFSEVQDDFRILRDSDGREMQLRKEWQRKTKKT
jgi:hypothetical protein